MLSGLLYVVVNAFTIDIKIDTFYILKNSDLHLFCLESV